MSDFVVTYAAMRPARMDGTCFYCNQPVGATHLDDCVLIKKRVSMRTTIEYEVDEPNFWTGEDIEHFKNASSWCAGNVAEEISRYVDEIGCLCGHAKFEYLADVSGPFLKER